MEKYICKVPLRYRNTINNNKIEFQHMYNLKINYTPIYYFNMELLKGDFKSVEAAAINISSNEDIIYLEVDAIYADNMDYVVQILQGLLEKILPSLTYKLHCLNDNKAFVQYKLTYDISQAHIQKLSYEKYDEYLKGKYGGRVFEDSINLREKVSIGVEQTVILDDFEIVYNSYNRNPLLKQVIDCYTRAMGDTDYLSKYFNLFTIIEALETYYQKDVNEKLLTEIEIKSLLEHIENANFEFKESVNHNIIKRIEDTLKRITVAPRGEKLLTILNEILEINDINVLDNTIKIDLKFTRGLIKQRNMLFHAKNLQKKELEQFKESVIYLFALCEVIIKKMVIQSNVLVNKEEI